jgi:hypothetical protein
VNERRGAQSLLLAEDEKVTDRSIVDHIASGTRGAVS